MIKQYNNYDLKHRPKEMSEYGVDLSISEACELFDEIKRCYDVLDKLTFICLECNGHGKIKDNSRPLTESAWVECQECKGVGNLARGNDPYKQKTALQEAIKIIKMVNDHQSVYWITEHDLDLSAFLTGVGTLAKGNDPYKQKTALQETIDFAAEIVLEAEIKTGDKDYLLSILQYDEH